jgi:SAM-dependent methyltransferase
VDDLPKLYRELASWWPILSAPEDYAEEAEIYRRALLSGSDRTPGTLLELGAGGGNNASHLKQHFRMTLVDLSPEMLEVSRKLNPECEHIQGDIRTVRLGRQFDAVFTHDAVIYMTSESDLLQAMITAYEHCRPGGVALFAPDCVVETFKSRTECGGHDRHVRSARYLSWTWDPDPEDSWYVLQMVYLLREGPHDLHTCIDRHKCGIFRHDHWLRLLSEVGFQPRSLPFDHSEVEPNTTYLFLGLKPAANMIREP